MRGPTTPTPNVKQAVPFFAVSDIDRSVRFYVNGLGFEMTKHWKPQGRLRWCWLQIGDAAIMLQEYRNEDGSLRPPIEKPGDGVSICFQCADALTIFQDARARGIDAARPFVGNAMWVTHMLDPDGYRLEFESPTGAPEETVYQDDAPSPGG